MSGPKTSVLSPNFICYSALTEKQKVQWAQKEILVCLQSMQECEKNFASLIMKISSFQNDECPDERIKNILEESKAYLDISLFDIDDNHVYTNSELSEIRKDGAENVGWYHAEFLEDSVLESKYLEYFQEIGKKTFQQTTNIARACASKSAKMKMQVKKMEYVYHDLMESAKEEMFQEGIRTSFYIPFKRLRKSAEADNIIKKINDSLEGVSTLILKDELIQQLSTVKTKAEEIKDAYYLNNFYQLVVRPFVEECNQYDAFYNAHFLEYEEYKTSYQIYCNELNLVPQEIEFSAEAISFYKEKSNELQEILLKRHTQESIMQMVNEVMAEMGYDLVAERNVVKKSGKQYHDELYLYGDGTAISVVQSSDGQMTMEIGGMDYGDRMPTDDEAKNMEVLMTSFCVDYKNIVEALAKKGLDMKTVSMLPPDAQYATIINLEDYEVISPVETISDIKNGERRATETKKERHMED